MIEKAVAIVDHQPVLCESLRAYLSNEDGMRVVGSATTLRAARNLLCTSRPDVVILDAETDTAVGVSVLKAMDDMASRPAVVLLMADEDHDLAARALQRGVSGFVLKSAPIRELVEAIHWAAKGQLWMSPPLLTGLLHQRPSASTTEAKGRLAQLTKREFDVLNLLIEGFHQSEISRRLFVSENTVRTHSQNLQRKLGVHSAVAAVSVALDAGLRPAA